jgi:hypothetical protein
MAISAAQGYAWPPEMQVASVLHAIFIGSASFLRTWEINCAIRSRHGRGRSPAGRGAIS